MQCRSRVYLIGKLILVVGIGSRKGVYLLCKLSFGSKPWFTAQSEGGCISRKFLAASKRRHCDLVWTRLENAVSLY